MQCGLSVGSSDLVRVDEPRDHRNVISFLIVDVIQARNMSVHITGEIRVSDLGNCEYDPTNSVGRQCNIREASRMSLF